MALPRLGRIPGGSAAATNPPRRIDLHRGEAFREWVQFLIDELERVFPAADGQSSQEEDLTCTWHRAVDLECAFFDNVYDN